MSPPIETPQPAIDARHARDLPRWLWIGLPAASLALVFTAAAILGDASERHYRLMRHEYGILELATVAFTLIGVAFGVATLVRHRRRLPRLMTPVLVLGVLAAIYYAGEESSWGQWYFGWETPPGWAEVNRQDETNLHNLKVDSAPAWVNSLLRFIFNNGPRQAMTVGCVVGGVIMPLALRRRLLESAGRNGTWYWMIPTYIMAPIAALAVGVSVLSKLHEDLEFLEVGGEFKEYCLAIVMLFYFASIWRRARSVF